MCVILCRSWNASCRNLKTQNRGAKYEEVFTAYFNGSYAGGRLQGSALAKERLFTFSNNNNGAVKEVNYYLDNGAKVVFMDTAAKATDSTVIITVVLDIPEGVPAYQK